MNATTLKRQVMALSLTALLAITLTGCFGDDDTGAEPSVSPTPEEIVAAGGGADDATSEETQPQDAEPEAEPEPAPEPLPLAGAECLHGTWDADNDSFLSRMQEFGDGVESVEGRVTLEFGQDGSLTTDYQDWLITMSAEGGTVTVHRSGIDRGTFSATDDTLTLADDQLASTITVNAGGMIMSVDPVAAYYDAVPYTCDPSEALIESTDGTLLLTR